LGWAKSWAENGTVKRHKALVEKNPQGAPGKFYIKEKVPDDLPAGEVPVAESSNFARISNAL